MSSTQELTEGQAAVAARRLLRSENVGTLATLYHHGPPGHGHDHGHGPPGHGHCHSPSSHNSSPPSYTPPVDEKLGLHHPPPPPPPPPHGPEGSPFCLFDYYVDVSETNGDPIFFSSTIQKSIVNLQHDDRACFTVRASSPYTSTTGYQPTPMSCGRVALSGKVVILDPAMDSELIAAARAAFITRHPDVRGWIDFNDFHFYRLRVEQIYWVGGFGNIHYIGGVQHPLYSRVPESDLPPLKIGYDTLPAPHINPHPVEDKFILYKFVDELYSSRRPFCFRLFVYIWSIFITISFVTWLFHF